MSQSYSQSSFGRDFMNVGSGSKFGQQGSRNFMSGPSSNNLPSIFGLGNRAPPPPPLSSQRRGDSNQANNILSSFGLSSRDLDELSRYPEEKITPESLPQLIQQIKRRRSEDMSMMNYRERLPREPLRMPSNDWGDEARPFKREGFADRSSGLDHVVDYDHGSRSREPVNRDRMNLDDRFRDREGFREDRFLSDAPFRKHSTDYEPMGYNQQQERSVFEKTRGIPSVRNIDDFHGRLPKDLPHVCSLCDMPLHTKKAWHDHVNGLAHKRNRLLLLEVYPDWNGHGMGDTFMLHQSTNHAPGLLGPPPPAPQSLLSMGSGPDGRHGGQRMHPMGMEERGPGPRHMQNRPPMQQPKYRRGRVVHIINFVRARNLKNMLLRLAAPFGEITNHLILNQMNEAFIEMANPEDAMAVVDYYSTNPALIMGQPVQVHLSQKYKRIQKPKELPDTQPKPKNTEAGRVVNVTKLPTHGYTDAALVGLAENFGKVKTYILMRVRNQAFIEMERSEDAQDMVKRCANVPLEFQGKTLKVELSERYKKLVLRIPNKLIDQKEKDRKRPHSPDRKAGPKGKQMKTGTTKSGDGGEAASEEVTTDDAVHTSEETDQKDIVTDSCDPDLLEDEELEEDEEAAAALLESSSSVADDEVQDPNEANDEQDDQTEAKSTRVTRGKPKGASKFSGNIDNFVTLDEVGDEENLVKRKSAGRRAKKQRSSDLASASVEETEQENEAEEEPENEAEEETAENKTFKTAPASKPDATRAPETEDCDLGPYRPNNPVGVDFVIPKTGYYCKLCSLFYTSEEVAKVTHCSTLPHYQKLKKHLKTAKNP